MDANPYQPPRSEAPDTREQKFAKRLLSFRDKPLTMNALYRNLAKRMAILILYFVLAIAFFVWVDLQPGVYLMLGLLMGILVCNFAVVRMQTKLWPMQRRVLDWQKVERMAGGEQIGN